MSELYAAKQALDLQFYGGPENQGPGSTYAALDVRRTREDLGAILVMPDLELCERLLALGMTGSSAAALALVPAIEVAWADGKIQEPERVVILGGSNELGITQPECRQLLEHWLKSRPSPSLMAAWVGFVRALSRAMSAGDHDELRDSLVTLARGIASSAGGIAGFGKISGSEQKLLDQIRAAFDRPE